MHTRFEDFKPEHFSFHEDPVLVLDQFWTKDERQQFHQAMGRATWTALREMPHLHETFPHCGNWAKAHLARHDALALLDRLTLPCILSYMESFSNIARRHMNFNYYSYGAGDCLLTHDDRAPVPDSVGRPEQRAAPRRRLAVVTYLHEEWQPDWGGELMIYRSIPGRQGPVDLAITHCIAPTPGSLVLFTVPRFHRVCRVDPVSGSYRRLSIGGWFMTEHE